MQHSLRQVCPAATLLRRSRQVLLLSFVGFLYTIGRCGVSPLPRVLACLVLSGAGAGPDLRPVRRQRLGCCAARRSPRPSGQRHPGASAGRHQPGRERPARPADRRVHPWPWTINAEGQGLFYDTKAQAVAAVRALQARGVRSIDVGCMQVNLMHHPDAFPTLEQAFDPQTNAAYAGAVPEAAVRPDRRLDQGGGAVSFGDARTRRRLPAPGAGGLAGREAGQPAARHSAHATGQRLGGTLPAAPSNRVAA